MCVSWVTNSVTCAPRPALSHFFPRPSPARAAVHRGELHVSELDGPQRRSLSRSGPTTKNTQFRNCERIPDCEMPLTWHRLFALARSFAVPRQKSTCQSNRHRPYCSDGLAVPLSESASLRRVVPCRNAHALVLLSHAHRPRSISLDRSTVAPQRQWEKVSTLHAEHSILGAVDIYDWRLRRAARKLGCGARSASSVWQRCRRCHLHPQRSMLRQHLSICRRCLYELCQD